MNARLLAAVLIALTALVLLAPRATSRPVAVTPSGDLGAAETDQPRTGAPSDGVSTTAPAPRPTAMTIEPASAVNPAMDMGKPSITGTATYYCRPGISRCTAGYPGGMYAAAGPEVRAMLGPDWRGKFVIVTDRVGTARVVQLIDWCLCGGDHVLDLYWDVFQGIHNPVTITEEP